MIIITLNSLKCLKKKKKRLHYEFINLVVKEFRKCLSEFIFVFQMPSLNLMNSVVKIHQITHLKLFLTQNIHVEIV